MSTWEDLVMKLRQISDENWVTVLKWIHPIISWLMKCWKTYKKYMRLFRRNPKRANNCETISKEQFYDMPIKVSRNPISFTSCIAMNIFWIGLKDKWIGYKLPRSWCSCTSTSFGIGLNVASLLQIRTNDQKKKEPHQEVHCIEEIYFDNHIFLNKKRTILPSSTRD